MTREEEILKEAKEFADGQSMALIKPDDAFAFKMGAEWADSHPHWISVEEKLPNDGVWAITINKVNYFGVCYRNYGKWFSKFGNEHADITYWIPLPQPPKEGGEE